MLPSCRLTPSRWELLSRPLRELPCPFLCAIALALTGIRDAGSGIRKLVDSDHDIGDTNARVSAAMSALLAKSLAALLLEHTNLRPARLAIDHADHPVVGVKQRPCQHL